MHLNPLSKLVLTSLGAALSAGILLVVFWWASADVRSAKDTLSSIETSIVSLEEDRLRAAATEEALRSRTEALKRIDRFLVDRERPVEFIENLEALALKTENSVAIDIDSSKPKAGWLLFRLTVDGSRESIFKYLKLLELMSYEIKVEDMTFQGTVPLAPASKIAGTKTVVPTARLIILISVKTRI